MTWPFDLSDVYTSATAIDAVSDLDFLSKEQQIFQITITDPVGYSEHLVIGYADRDKGRTAPIAFFQTYAFNPEGDIISVVRRMLKLPNEWQKIFAQFDPSKIEELLQRRKSPLVVRDDTRVKILIHENSVDARSFDLRYGEVDQVERFGDWLVDLSESFGFEWKNETHGITDVPPFVQ